MSSTTLFDVYPLRRAPRWAAWLSVVLLIAAICSAPAAGQTTPPRIVDPLDFGWRFAQRDVPNGPDAGLDDASWQDVDLPHDWSIEGEYREDNPAGGAGAYLPGGVGWYRRVVDVPPEWKDKRVFIEFDAAQRNSDVWINGHHLGHRPYGYISFSYDLTPHL